MYNCANMMFLRLAKPFGRTVTAVFLSRHPPNFNGAGRAEIPFTPQGHFLIYALKGHRDITGPHAPYAVEPGTIRIHPAGGVYQVRTDQKYEEIALAVNTLPGDRLSRGNEPDAPESAKVLFLPLIMDVRSRPLAAECMRELLGYAAVSTPAAAFRRKALLHLLLAELNEINAPRASSPRTGIPWVRQRLEATLDEAPDIDQLARSIGMSRRNLMRVFKAETGMGLLQFVLARRVALAQSMLRSDPSMPLRALADQLGFFDEFHFGHLFKKQVGVSPKRFAKSSVIRG